MMRGCPINILYCAGSPTPITSSGEQPFERHSQSPADREQDGRSDLHLPVLHIIEVIRLTQIQFTQEVERHLTGQENEPWKMLYFKVYKNQMAVIEQTLEISSVMFGGQKARGYCLEMICADFLVGANLDDSGSSEWLLLALSRLYLLLPSALRQEFLLRVSKAP
jgi:hypothetical protein